MANEDKTTNVGNKGETAMPSGSLRNDSLAVGKNQGIKIGDKLTTTMST